MIDRFRGALAAAIPGLALDSIDNEILEYLISMMQTAVWGDEAEDSPHDCVWSEADFRARRDLIDLGGLADTINGFLPQPFTLEERSLPMILEITFTPPPPASGTGGRASEEGVNEQKAGKEKPAHDSSTHSPAPSPLSPVPLPGARPPPSVSGISCQEEEPSDGEPELPNGVTMEALRDLQEIFPEAPRSGLTVVLNQARGNVATAVELILEAGGVVVPAPKFSSNKNKNKKSGGSGSGDEKSELPHHGLSPQEMKTILDKYQVVDVTGGADLKGRGALPRYLDGGRRGVKDSSNGTKKKRKDMNEKRYRDGVLVSTKGDKFIVEKVGGDEDPGTFVNLAYVKTKGKRGPS